ncbi:MAG: hypothetical protein HKL90_01515 [Elusimicrobia bacterium]|nr:hypothetical protein [Elusimicrobiota bacterium]
MLPRLLGVMLTFQLVGTAALAASPAPDPDVVTVIASTVSTRYPVYAQVEPPVAWGNARPSSCPASDRLWLKAAFYGADVNAIRAGMSGTFVPASSGRTVPVKVCAKFGLLRADGGESVALLAASPRPDWANGMFGTVTLIGPVETLVSVPTRALILDGGRWWVLARTPAGDVPQEVELGPTRGWQTFIERGLKPGTRIVVADAYLRFHRNVAQSYQAPN